MRPVPLSQRQVYFSAALTAAAVALVSPSLHWPASSPAVPVADAARTSPAPLLRMSPAPSLPALSAPRPFAFHRAASSPAAPVPSSSAPRVSDDLESAAVIPSPAPSRTAAPPPAAQQASPPPAAVPPAVHTAQAVPYPSYTGLPSQSAAYGGPEAYAESLVGAAQFSCLKPLWDRESGWNVYAQNPGSGAYGIPQALPGDKMASAGPDWQTNGDTQVRWGVSYVDSVYGSPCAALAHENADGWY